jgi:hypothetical protein
MLAHIVILVDGIKMALRKLADLEIEVTILGTER